MRTRNVHRRLSDADLTTDVHNRLSSSLRFGKESPTEDRLNMYRVTIHVVPKRQLTSKVKSSILV